MPLTEFMGRLYVLKAVVSAGGYNYQGVAPYPQPPYYYHSVQTNQVVFQRDRFVYNNDVAVVNYGTLSF